MQSAVRRRSGSEDAVAAVRWSRGSFSFLSIRACVCLKITKPKGKREGVGEKKDWSERVMTFVFDKYGIF